MTFPSLHALGALICTSSLFLLPACVDRGTGDDIGDDTATQSTDDTGDDDARPGSDDRGAGDTSDAQPTPGDGSAWEACTEVCAAFASCFPDDDLGLEACTLECTEAYDEESPACRAAFVEFVRCYTTLSCDAWFGDEACIEQEDELEETCGQDGDHACEIGIGGAPGECGAYRSCHGDPAYEIACDEAVCICFEDDEEVGQCPSQGVCDEDSSILEHAASCCGW